MRFESLETPVSDGRRAILPGTEYDRYFPKADGRDKVIIRDGEVKDTLGAMEQVVHTYLGDTAKLAPVLQKPGLEATCRAIWTFVYRHIQYRLDRPGLEQLRRPARTWQDRKSGADCDCMSILVSSVLTNLKIPHSFRVTRYSAAYWQHVYVVVPKSGGGHYVIDGVLSRFDYEKPYTAKMDFPMDISGINVALLSGTEDGATSLEEIYAHLLATRESLLRRPGQLPAEEERPLLQMLNYAIQYFYTDKRDAALEILERNEAAMDAVSLPSYSLDGELGKVKRSFFKNVKKAAKEAATSAKQVSPMAVASSVPLYTTLPPVVVPKVPIEVSIPTPSAPVQTQTPKPAPKGLKKVLQTAGNAVLRYNPVSIAARNGFLLALKLDVSGIASKLKWAYASPATAAAKGITQQDYEKSLRALAKVESLFAKKLQGKAESLKDAILKGRAGGLNGQLGEPLTAAAITAAAPLIIATINILKEVGLIGENVQVDENGIILQINKANSGQALPAEEYIWTEAPMEAPVIENKNENEMDTPKPSGPGIIGWVKANPVPTLAIAGAVGLLAMSALSKGKRTPGLSGLPKGGRRKKVKKGAYRSKRRVKAVLIK
ncbi:MAG: hypothetical protein ACOYOO_05900 [Saprospiraceae bacterium]